ncbi:tRNA (adenosine(37)-N6)-threonylcarbamoyltransferase complex dimerization subunit type 1 TsaB [Thermomonas hydrothermalis]|uniref:tRNA threonylcarbamoyladenosine biosynthesis protein TsaB n=1 Tax=Thermomonas hydrothermalis TaxID=213588 RepID=A0A1M4ZMC8_9GAMM|nr:tRNA (adenosine(37)-N6)-threonylcarbamoyltransferase complex dimerization subunit type 1 TsaB [Thermomonas hydrothermalis]SHF18947.1 tRNA threonylcarbamoyladenosine biosynthesis protein TsaB [Thermomonas hydrothermalis]
MKLLALETATEACSVALYVDGAIRETFAVAPRQHAGLVLPWADALLAEAGITRRQLDAIALGRGPGAFTGVRLAASIAQGIALALDLPLLPVSTLAALAWQGDGPRRLAAIDARMGEVYLGAFAADSDGLVPLAPEVVLPPAQAQLPAGDGSWVALGTGFAAGQGVLVQRWAGRLRQVDAAALPHAADVARLAAPALARGEGIAPERLEPAYLRNDVALTLAQQQARRG